MFRPECFGLLQGKDDCPSSPWRRPEHSDRNVGENIGLNFEPVAASFVYHLLSALWSPKATLLATRVHTLAHQHSFESHLIHTQSTHTHTAHTRIPTCERALIFCLCHLQVYACVWGLPLTVRIPVFRYTSPLGDGVSIEQTSTWCRVEEACPAGCITQDSLTDVTNQWLEIPDISAARYFLHQ